MSSRYSEYLPERPMVGYGMNQPDPQWPNGAKIAISFVINWEEGGERNVLEGDDGSETFIIETLSQPSRIGERDEMVESQFEYGPRVGLPRLMRLFKRYNMTATMYTVAAALECAPHFGPELVKQGFEIACHGNRWINYMNVSPEEEEKHIHQAIDRLQKYTGDPSVPRGWMIGRRSNASQRLYCHAAKERGLEFLYSSDSYGDDLPYWLESPLASEGEPDEGMLIVPYSLDCNDVRFVVPGSGWSSGEDFYKHLVDTFDVLYEEGEAGQAKMMSIGLHNRCIGRPGRLAAVEKFMQYISSKEGVWVARRDEIARHWREQFPYCAERCQGRVIT
ncbi:hypothetical protein E1B28_006520 [Marasmius oreades]|uniref:NodB homology domain-containing protein n=1 Tax=Marasmius oreades TaxID=181124 RepID=A0A9P7UVT8_9AGAR|nr:uncharacterized protein E1B28_006520 [Marasmius oreades]KAG7095825.1 hypothetical protein E1B28_006520 [Marasmius oreades]